MTIKVLIIGDIVGKTGREAVKYWVRQIRLEEGIDLVIANAENAAGGFGLTPKIVDELLDFQIDLLTSGNHIWSKKEIYQSMDYKPILRPLNYPPGVPGRGSIIVSVGDNKVGVINLVGRVFINESDCPFRVVDIEVERLREKTPNIIVDMHAEATSEKIAMGWFLDGRVSAVVGTHTHVQTADERILPEGTAYISDIGMAGAINSVIGIKKDIVIKKFLTQMPQRFDMEKGPAKLEGVICELNPQIGRAISIKRIRMEKE